MDSIMDTFYNFFSQTQESEIGHTFISETDSTTQELIVNLKVSLPSAPSLCPWSLVPWMAKDSSASSASSASLVTKGGKEDKDEGSLVPPLEAEEAKEGKEEPTGNLVREYSQTRFQDTSFVKDNLKIKIENTFDFKEKKKFTCSTPNTYNLRQKRRINYKI
jgi:hypothetical protein